MDPTAEQSTSQEETVCKLFHAYIFRQEFLNHPYEKVADINGNYATSVWDLLHPPWPERFNGTKNTPSEWIWVHLPAVNVCIRDPFWPVIHNAISLLQVEEFVKKSFTNASGINVAPQQFDQRVANIKAQRVKKTAQDTAQGETSSDRGQKEPGASVGEDSSSVKQGTEEHDTKDVSSDSKGEADEPAMKSQSVPQQSIQEQFSETEMFSLALPYLDSRTDVVKSEKLEQLRQHYGAFEGYPTNFLDDSKLRSTEVIFSRTLDQCFFSSAHSTINLDSDQIVYNYLNELSEKWRKIQTKKTKTKNDPLPTTLLPSEQEIELRYHKTDQGRRLITSPLRLWKIGNVVISAFPDQEYSILPDSELQQLIYRLIWKSCPISAMDLVLDLVHIFIDFVDEPFNSGLGLSPLWIFERVIAEEAEKQVVRYKEFEKIMKQKYEDKSERNDDTPEADLLVTPAVVPNPAGPPPSSVHQDDNDHVLEVEKQNDPTSLIAQEAESFKNVMDLRDELGMIGSVIKEQEVAMAQFTTYLNSRGKPTKGLEAILLMNEPRGSGQLKEASETDPNLQNLNQKMGDIFNRVQRRQSRIAGLDKRTSMIEKALNHLLDIKLKRSSLEEAGDTKNLAADTNKVAKLSKDIEDRTHSVLRATNSVVTNTNDLARESDERAKQSAKQSALIFAFTVVTIWFTPLSFVTGFFAIPSGDFPQDSNQQDVDWKKWQIGVGLLVAFVVTLLFSGSVLVWYKIRAKDREAQQEDPKNDNRYDRGVSEQGPDEKVKRKSIGEANPSTSIDGSPEKPSPLLQPPSPKPMPQDQRRSWDWPLRSKEPARDSLAQGRSGKSPVAISADAMV
ncbi:hypothetical protein NUW58_g648 [Xylaria curta]|uniref:Uncharacterized protein n=1 Tax=Xylaria curta TaxID=42375 RepID=A0ACC1PNK8_9PEZI|nr:hypothetical protein NUW58_g648 [Xylaria curta]